MIKPYPALVSALVMAAALANLTSCRRPPPQPPHVTPPNAAAPAHTEQNRPALDQNHRRANNPPPQ